MFYPCSKEDIEPIVSSNPRNNPVEERATRREVLQSLIAAQERELSNIARDLHDDICQRLAMLSLKIEKVAKAWATGQKQVGEQLEQIWRQCSVLTGDVQALSHELHPSILDNLGLVTAVKSLCRELSEQSSVVVEFTSASVPDFLPRDVSLSLFRLIQEALHNSVKYSGEKHFEVHLRGCAGGIQLEVRDRGVGFDAARIKKNGGLGLISMRERIQLLNGTIDIDSRPYAGTRIRAQVPLPAQLKAGYRATN
jgi:signal transduction histidine kinase